MYDLIIKNGKIVDGTGRQSYQSDIAISNGKIVRIFENITEKGKEVIDAQGLTVTPGFIDSHSHSDSAVFEYPDMIEKIEQGITTSMSGQCGITSAPIGKDVTDENSYEIKGYGKASRVLKTFGTMVNAVKNVPLGSNIKCFVGHGALRKATVGYENRKPTESEMADMKALLREAMENGAVGLSYGLIYTPSVMPTLTSLLSLQR